MDLTWNQGDTLSTLDHTLYQTSCFALPSRELIIELGWTIMTPWIKPIRNPYLSCCWRQKKRKTQPPFEPLESRHPHLSSVSLWVNIPDNLMLHKIHSGDSLATCWNKYSALLTLWAFFIRNAGRSCIFTPNLFLIPPHPNKTAFKPCHPPSTAVLSISLMSVASTNPCHASFSSEVDDNSSLWSTALILPNFWGAELFSLYLSQR